ncbi:hypothetical protein Airi02_006280 [Actinoallomurus iriomotensis]|uniref:Cell wall-active antibiotics response LiaF-like C-terminal domain-containing protein n=2 Tax=Actinoallomurus iriomotensis TaxID=478107 RepID=A0A9W6RZ05_9ACTN|nr:hypothetical protein Airi02_006280 [Actinoallomurus iriomotensis]
MELSGKPSEPDPARMRASDADRDRVAEQLREALAEGRLTAEEHAERLDAVYEAKTYAELAPIVEDLPATGGVRPPETGPSVRDDLPPPQSGTPNIVAIFSGADRRGRWLIEPQTNVVAVCGGVELDLRQAVLSQREVTINIVNVMGGVQITVPPGVRVVNSIAAVLGGTSLPSEDTVDAAAPVVRLTGFNLLGGVDVKRRTADGADLSGKPDHRTLHEEQRRIHLEFREKQREIHREFRDQQRALRRRRRG